MAQKPHWHTDYPVTPESIAEAKRAQLLERIDVQLQTGCVVDDEGRLGMVLGNAISAACYGPRGEKR